MIAHRLAAFGLLAASSAAALLALSGGATGQSKLHIGSVESTVGELLAQYDAGDETTQEIVREMLLETENGIFWASMISARETKTKPIYCRPLDEKIDPGALVDVLRRGAKSPDFAGAPYGAGLTLVLKHLYPCG